jgi:hypothetical protein
MSDSEILAIVNPIMDNLMDASTAIDHKRHTRDFTDRLKSIVTEDYLKKVCIGYQKEKGFFGERSILCLLRRPDAVAVLWKQKFMSADGDFVAEALFVENNGEYRVDHVMVW